jgi:periplasmic protein TonB
MQEKFLSSFVLPERQVEPPKVASANPDPNAQQKAQTAENAAEKILDPNAPQTGTEGNTENATPERANNNANNTNNKQPEGKKPINGGILNGKAIYLPQPEVAAGEASGVVLVQVLIDENGAVIDAKAVSGPQHLQAAAVNAARLARFSPTTLMGEPVKVAGTLSYNFTRSN